MIWIILAALVLVSWIVYTINSFRAKEIKVTEGLSGVEVALTKRYDVLSKMLDASKGYLEYERSLFLETVRIRTNMTLKEISSTEEQMDQVTEQIYAVAEKYPDLKSSRVFMELEAGISDAEEHFRSCKTCI